VAWRQLPWFIVVLLLLDCTGIFYTSTPRFRRGKKPAPQSQKQSASPARHPIEVNKGRLPWPVNGKIVANFGVQLDPKYGTKTKNLGIDISCQKNSPVKAISKGRVSYADAFMGQGLMVIIEHGGGYHTVYTRLNELRVSAGQVLNAGDVIGLSGEILHFEIRIGGKAVDPMPWLGKGK